MAENASKIAFGTDGWRAEIGNDFTLENVARVARAMAEWVSDEYGTDHPVVVGHDSRRMGEDAARVTSAVLAETGLPVYLAQNITPTPAISWATKEYNCSAGVVITASHNPPGYNGFKVKGHFGGSALPSMIAGVEKRLDGTSAAALPDRGAVDECVRSGRVRIRDVRGEFLAMLAGRIDLEAIRNSGIRVVHDAMYGAGRGAFRELLGPSIVDELRSDIDPTFQGISPEPIERNLSELKRRVMEHPPSVGIANDGDADRIGMVDEKGRFVDSHRMLALLVRYLSQDLGLTGDVVKTFSTTDMLDEMASAYGLILHTTPIGFKYIGEIMLGGDVLVGGEESGGIAVKGHIPERDGIYIGLLLLEMMAKHGKPLSVLVDGLSEEFGRHDYYRVDVHTTEEAKNRALELLAGSGGLKEIGGRPVRLLEALDGYKHRLEGAWLLVRPSGTEPVLRIYAEARGDLSANILVDDAVQQLGL